MRPTRHLDVASVDVMEKQASANIGVTGLAVMGRNLARNLARHGHTVALHNRTSARTHALVRHPAACAHLPPGPRRRCARPGSEAHGSPVGPKTMLRRGIRATAALSSVGFSEYPVHDREIRSKGLFRVWIERLFGRVLRGHVVGCDQDRRRESCAPVPDPP